MHMPVDQPGDQVSVLKVYNLPRLMIIADSSYVPLVDGDVAILDLSGKGIHYLGIGKQEVGRGITSGYGDQFFEAHS